MYYSFFNGEKISALGMGGIHYPGVNGDQCNIDREAASKLVKKVFDSGINYFDTASIYQGGDSERFLGEELKKYPRDSYFLTTKFNVMAGEDMEKTVEEQFERLQTDKVDIYMLHALDENTVDLYTDPERDYIGKLRRMKEEGRCRYIGFSSHADPETLERFLDVFDGYDMALIQLNFVDWKLLEAKRQYEVLTERGIPVWVMEPLKGGRLARMNEESAKILKDYAPDKSVASWGFRFLMGLDNVKVILSGMGDSEALEDNLKTFSERSPLSDEEMKVLETAADKYVGDMGVPCSACRYCTDTCPSELDIPLLIKSYNEKNISGDRWRFSVLKRKKWADECIGCGECLRHCPQKIDIPGIMEKLKAEGK